MKMLLAALAVLVFAVPAMALDLTGTNVNLVSPLDDWQDGTFDVVFEVCGVSPNTEYLNSVEFIFLDCITVNSAFWDEVCWTNEPYNVVAGGNSALFFDTEPDDGFGYHGTDCCSLYTVNVTVACEGDLENLILWYITGDAWQGVPPNEVEGVITGPVGNEVSTWGTVKTLFR